MKTFMNNITRKVRGAEGPRFDCAETGGVSKMCRRPFLRGLINHGQDRRGDACYRRVVVQKCLNMFKSVSSANGV